MRFPSSVDPDPRRLVAGRLSDKRMRTAYRITRAAQRLAVEKGYDEFTLDELAQRAEVSRRTLFNYFDGKLEATIGAGPWVDQDDIDRYLDGGPTGESVDDLAA
ncbi:helix-turn-helix domain-containing protein [Flexivirga meconopsidis]|uniref:helix-turn-helix domain-containing protein n=1 Tax=Flexivirga meconopsidis TaxID=2977121 RepID=UPI00223F19F3|nr:helix-turn-helix domain-containing protein [Flexivirga meconopsidis]